MDRTTVAPDTDRISHSEHGPDNSSAGHGPENSRTGHGPDNSRAGHRPDKSHRATLDPRHTIRLTRTVHTIRTFHDTDCCLWPLSNNTVHVNISVRLAQTHALCDQPTVMFHFTHISPQDDPVIFEIELCGSVQIVQTCMCTQYCNMVGRTASGKKVYLIYVCWLYCLLSTHIETCGQ